MLPRALPTRSLALTPIGLGVWTLSRKYWGDDHDDARAIRTIHAALDSGINWVDTAPLYGEGHGDRLVAEALSGRPEVIVASKVGVLVEGTASGHAESKLTAEHVVADCEASLRRLKRDRIDLLQVHWPCNHGTPLEETVGALDGLRAAGKIREWGLCNYDADGIAEARMHATQGVASLQTPLSLLRREAEHEVLGVCGQGPQPTAVFAYETLCRGLLTGRFRSLPTFPATDQRSWDERFQGRRFAHARALLDDLQKVADRVHIGLPELVVGWVLAKKQVHCAIVGARTPDQIIQTATAARLVSKSKLWAIVDKVAALHGGG